MVRKTKSFQVSIYLDSEIIALKIHALPENALDVQPSVSKKKSGFIRRFPLLTSL